MIPTLTSRKHTQIMTTFQGRQIQKHHPTTLGPPTCPSPMKEAGSLCGLVQELAILCTSRMARYYYSDQMYIKHSYVIYMCSLQGTSSMPIKKLHMHQGTMTVIHDSIEREQ